MKNAKAAQIPNQSGPAARPFEYNNNVCVKEGNAVKAKHVSKKNNIRAISESGEDTLYLLKTYKEYDLEREEDGFPLSDLQDPETDLSNTFFESSADLLGWLSANIEKSPLARALLTEAARQGWSVKCNALTDGGYFLNDAEKLLILDHGGLSVNAIGKASHLRCAMLSSFIKGLREIWQETRLPDGASHYKPEDVLMAERIRAADVDLIAVQCAWELRADGQTDLWRFLLGGDDGDLALVFACAIEKNPASLYDGKALSHGFTQWFEDALRVESAEHGALELLDGALAESDNAAVLGEKRLNAKDIETISALPSGPAYLKGRGEEILKGPAYAGLNDPINQAHLFQIVYDSKVCMAGGVPFRDASLARKLFPEQSCKKH